MAWLIAAKTLKKCRNQVWIPRKQIKFIAKKQYYTCWEMQLWVATVNL